MDNPVGAIRYAIRQFRLSPVFTASAVLTLSLGIGGTTAIFTLIHAVMLRSLPVADPDRLRRAAGLLRRSPPQQSARPLDPDSARTDGHRRQLAAAPAGLRLAARHRPPQTRRHHRRHRAAAHERPAPVDPA